MADKADDVKDDQSILDVLKDEEQDSPKAEPSPVKEEKPEAKETKEEAPEKDKSEESPEEKKEEPEAKAEEEPEKSEDKPTKADERKTQLNTEIRDLVAKRNALKQEVEKANSEVYQPATENELTDDTNPDTGKPYTPLEARVEAMRQQQEMEKYNTQVAEAQLTISHESEKVLNEFPIFNPESPEYDKELAEEAADLLSANLVYDTNTNQVIGSNVSPYRLYKTIARAHQTSTVKGQIQGREDTEQMLANADSPGNAAPIKKEKDPVLDILKSDDY